jgi:hypothetical protein
MNITITAKNADELDNFTPVSGTWRIENFSGGDGTTEQDVQESIVNWMDASYGLRVAVFHADGRAITSEIPSEGTYVATRI